MRYKTTSKAHPISDFSAEKITFAKQLAAWTHLWDVWLLQQVPQVPQVPAVGKLLVKE
jgi:hypothetical protein